MAARETQDRTDPGFRVFGPVFNASEGGSGGNDAATASASQTRIDLYAEVGGFFGVWPDEFKASLDAVKGGVDLHIHSPGGDAFDGIAIYNMLRQHDGTIDVTVDGLAASAASVIAMAGDSVKMSRGSQLMIHDAWGLSIGNADDMESTKGKLDKASESMADIYAAKAGGTAGDWRTAMKAESWYTANEAVDAGLADKIETDTAAIKSRWDLKIFAHAGREEAPDPLFPAGHRTARQPVLTNTTTATGGTFATGGSIDLTYNGSVKADAVKVMASIKAAAERAASKTPATETSANGTTGTTTEKEASDMPTAAKIQAALGLSEEATAKLLALLAADDDGTDPNPDPNPDPKPDDEPKAKSKGYLPKATKEAESVVLDPETLAKLQAQARLGMEAHNEMKKQKRDAILDKAMGLGKFPPSRREHYATMYDADPDGAVELFDRMAENAVPVDVLGYSGVSETAKSEADRAYANMGWE